jgi:hypothetical protein
MLTGLEEQASLCWSAIGAAPLSCSRRPLVPGGMSAPVVRERLSIVTRESTTAAEATASAAASTVSSPP